MDVDPEFLAELRRLHSRGWDDRKIARGMAANPTTVRAWRHRIGLDEPGEDEDTDDADVYERAAVYRSICCGNDDESIAAETGLPLDAVRRYRSDMPDWWCRGYEDAERIGGDHDD